MPHYLSQPKESCKASLSGVLEDADDPGLGGMEAEPGELGVVLQGREESPLSILFFFLNF